MKTNHEDKPHNSTRLSAGDPVLRRQSVIPADVSETVVDGKNFLASTDRTLIMRAGVGATARIIQRTQLTFPKLLIDRPILIWVKQGTKTVEWPGGRCKVQAGEAIALAGGNTFDITNSLSNGAYEALWLVWDSTVLADHAAKRQRTNATVKRAHAIAPFSSSLAMSFGNAIIAIGDPYSTPDDIARHRLAEVLIWLEQHGSGLDSPSETGIDARVRKVLSSEVSRHWTAPEIAKHLSVSAPTLRRHLASANLSLRDLRIDVRMSYALTLLQCTELPILQIAMGVGYDSASKFAVRFRKRFGCAPSEIRSSRETS